MLASTFDLIFRKRFDCDAQRERLYDRFQGEQLDVRLAAFNQAKGCGGSITKQPLVRYAPFELRTCPCNFHNKATLLELWGGFSAFDSHGILPFPGAYMQQPAKLLEAYTLLKSLKTDHEAQQAKRK